MKVQSNDKGLTQNEFLFDSIKKKHTLRRYLTLGLIALTILFSLIWIGVASYSELITPPLHTVSSIRLFQFASTRIDKLKSKKILEKSETERIYIWPEEGIDFVANTSNFTEEVWKILMNKYPNDILKLSEEEKKILINYSLPTIEKDILIKISEKNFINQILIDKLNNESEGKLETLLPLYIGFNRYKWLGFTKILYFIITEEKKDTYKIFMASVSDAADKTSLLAAIFLPMSILLLSVLTLFFVNIGSYQKQQSLYKIESRLFSANSFSKLVRIVIEEFTLLGLDISSMSIQVLRDIGFTLYSIDHRIKKAETKLVLYEEDSISFQRFHEDRQNIPVIYESFNTNNSKENQYSLTVPIIDADKKIAFANFNFKAKGLGFNKMYFIQNAFSGIQTAFTNILASIEEAKIQDWKEIKQWFFERREESPDVLFDLISKNLIGEDFSHKLPNIPKLDSVYLEEEKWICSFANVEKDIGIDINEFSESARNNLLQNNKTTIVFVKEFCNIFIPLSIHGTNLFIFLKTLHADKDLTFFAIDYLQIIFYEYSNHINNYYERILKDKIHNELIYESTGLQEEVKEIIEVTANQIYSGWDYSVTMPKEKINSVIKNKVKEEKKFFAYGFGAAIELDLTRSSELKKTVNPAIMFSYERSIEDANSFLQNKLEEIENKFVTRNQSGGDGDSFQFFFTTKNSRVGMEKKSEITPSEKRYYEEKILNALFLTNAEFYRRRIPMKLGFFPIDSSQEMNVSLEKGSLKINSYLQGLVDYSRSVKSYRLSLEGNEVPSIELIFSSENSQTKIGLTQMQVFQPWSINIPTYLLDLVPIDILDKYNIDNFMLKDSTSESRSSPPKYSELSFKGYYKSLFRIYPELTKIPLSWTVPLAESIILKLYEFSKSRNGNVSEILEEFVKIKKVSFKQNIFSIGKFDLIHFLSRDIQSINGQGIYMSLEQLNPLSLNSIEFIELMEMIIEIDLPHLKEVHKKAVKLIHLQNRLPNLSINELDSELANMSDFF
ncbi:MAG: hypothetical protein IPL26_22395 [Leptospiraceae bacterium]|nr:hypothetical protein [Leptospiraceae bacterium]